MNRFAQTPLPVEVSGFALDELAPLSDVFARLMADQGEGGAALTVYRDGRPVVDLVGGSYRPDSAQLLFSATKPITAFAAAHAAAAGLLDLDRPLGAYWLAMAKPSTASVTASMVLSHRAGLAAVDRVLTLEDVLAGEAERAVEVQEPYWEPGTAHGYHSFTYGVLLDGIFTRTVGCTVGEYVDREFREPLGLDLWIGTPERELPRVHQSTVSEQWSTPASRAYASGIPAGTGAQLRRNEDDVINDPRFLAGSFPATSGVATARSLARLGAATLDDLANGRRILSAADRFAMTASRSNGPDRVLGIVTHFGRGVQRPFPQFPMLGRESYGHEGANGCVLAVDTELGVSVGFTTSVYPPVQGASIRILGLLPSIRMLLGA